MELKMIIKKAKSNKNKDLYSSYGSGANKIDVKKYQGFRTFSKSTGGTLYKDVDTNISVREGLNRQDYEQYRPEETIPCNIKDIIKMCTKCYHKVGIIRNIIDLMTDFTIKGVNVVHENKKKDRIIKSWWKQVRGADRSERIANLAPRTGNVIIHRSTAKLSKSQTESLAAADIIGIPKKTILEKNEIPWNYTFLNPRFVEIIGEEDVAIFTGNLEYGMMIPEQFKDSLKENFIIKTGDKLAKKKGVVKRDAVFPLNKNELRVMHYKKDDWEPWAYPIIYAALDNILMLEKLRLADLSALDSAISRVRLWKLGSFEHKIIPNDAAFERLNDMLLSAPSGGQVDIMWGPDIELKESGQDSYNFLGQEKYVPHLNAIYECFGIPPTLVGSAVSGGMTNNFISLKNLTERLAYIRCMIKEFWDLELALIQKALGWQKPAQVIFERMNLSDEAAEKALLIQLVDRNLISDEAVRRHFGEIPEVEALRVKREERMRNSGTMPRKTSPWHNPEQVESLQKIALQTGQATPSEVGLELEDRKKGETTLLEQNADVVKKSSEAQKNTGIPQQGRPANSKDSKKRKKKTVKPRTSAMIWAKATQEKVGEYVNGYFLNQYNKKNSRQFTDEQSNKAEQAKFSVLCSMNLFDNINEDNINKILLSDLTISTEIVKECNIAISDFRKTFDRDPTLPELRDIQAMVYTEYKTNQETELTNG